MDLPEARAAGLQRSAAAQVIARRRCRNVTSNINSGAGDRRRGILATKTAERNSHSADDFGFPHRPVFARLYRVFATSCPESSSEHTSCCLVPRNGIRRGPAVLCVDDSFGARRTGRKSYGTEAASDVGNCLCHPPQLELHY